ncbi:DUF5666 domain-containing protein [Nocardia takedensis]
MSNPKDPWGQRPEDAPTEYLGPQGQPGPPGGGHTDDRTVAYGAPGPSHDPATERIDSWTPPPVNATRQMPTHESQWGGYETGGGAYGGGYGPQGQWPGSPGQPVYGPQGAPPPGAPVPEPPRPPKRNTGLWIALALGVIALIAVAGVAAGVLLGNDSDSDTAAGTTTRSFPTTGGQLPTQPSTTPRTGLPSGIPTEIPGLPGLDGLGATMGTISANSGGTLTLESLSGEKVTVRTTSATQVISLSGSKVADLKVGDVVMVQGDQAADGSIEAELIISAALPGGPR